jgi:hypothetical protein
MMLVPSAKVASNKARIVCDLEEGMVIVPPTGVGFRVISMDGLYRVLAFKAMPAKKSPRQKAEGWKIVLFGIYLR